MEICSFDRYSEFSNTDTVVTSLCIYLVPLRMCYLALLWLTRTCLLLSTLYMADCSFVIPSTSCFYQSNHRRLHWALRRYCSWAPPLDSYCSSFDEMKTPVQAAKRRLVRWTAAGDECKTTCAEVLDTRRLISYGDYTIQRVPGTGVRWRKWRCWRVQQCLAASLLGQNIPFS